MKRLILCFDGTWNAADREDHGQPCVSNVIQLAFRVAKRASSGAPQVVYYDQGVGTGNRTDRFTGGAFGSGLVDNVYDGYRFLIANYEPEDELFLFGFSRGAFTARSMAGMIRKCGILKRQAVARYREALDLYHDQRHPDDEGPSSFRRQNSICGEGPIPIQMIGVWDTVGALGIPLRGLRFLTHRKHQFHDTELSGSVQFACHALAIDEHRAPFAPTLWTGAPKAGQTVEQVWFCGAHSDVGGGYPERGLSDTALEWMMEKAVVAGLEFDPAVKVSLPLHPDAQGKVHNSKVGPYLATVGIDRTIGLTLSGAADPTQSLHPSVTARWDADPRYRPQSLREYFQRCGADNIFRVPPEARLP